MRPLRSLLNQFFYFYVVSGKIMPNNRLVPIWDWCSLWESLDSPLIQFVLTDDKCESLAEPRRVPGTSPFAVQFLSFSCSFRQKYCQTNSGVGASSEKSWIRHCEPIAPSPLFYNLWIDFKLDIGWVSLESQDKYVVNKTLLFLPQYRNTRKSHKKSKTPMSLTVK